MVYINIKHVINIYICIFLFFLLRMLEYGIRRMCAGKFGEAQIKLNKSALKRQRLRAMAKSWEDLQTIPGKEKERRKMILKNMEIKYSREFNVNSFSHSPYNFFR